MSLCSTIWISQSSPWFIPSSWITKATSFGKLVLFVSSNVKYVLMHILKMISAYLHTLCITHFLTFFQVIVLVSLHASLLKEYSFKMGLFLITSLLHLEVVGSGFIFIILILKIRLLKINNLMLNKLSF